MRVTAHMRNPLRTSGAGQAMVEFAAAATALFLLIFSLMTLGSAVYSYNTMSNAAREAVRYASIHSATSAAPATTSEIQQVALNYAVGLGLKSSDVVVTWPTDPNIKTKSDAQVSISYTYDLKIPFMKKAALSLSSTSRMLVSQ
jgi:Flp pilus assembly protein TadG